MTREVKVTRTDWINSIPEADLQQWVCDLATLNRWHWYHTHFSKHSVAGFPDLVMIRGHRIVVVELKRETGKVTPAQQVWLDKFRHAGNVEVYVWRPSDWLNNTIKEVLA